MRAILNAILQFIGAESLTDDEYAALSLEISASDQDKYNALKGVLASREAVSNMYRRLTSYFKAKGMVFSDEAAADMPILKTNVFVGSPL